MILAANRCRERSPNFYVADSISEIGDILNPRLGDIAMVVADGVFAAWRLQESDEAPDGLEIIQSNACEFVWVNSGPGVNVVTVGANSNGSSNPVVMEETYDSVVTARDVASATGRALVFPPGTYRFPAGSAIQLNSIPIIIATGATLIDLKISLNGTSQQWHGGIFKFSQITGTPSIDATEVVNISGTNVRFQDFVIDYSNMSGVVNEDTYTGIEVGGATNILVTNGDIDMFSRSCITVFHGTRMRFSDLHIRGADDGIVLKATIADTTNVVIENIVSHRNANIVSFGTEIAFAVRSVTITNCTGFEVTTALWFKCSRAAYPNGIVEDVVATNIVIRDPLGLRFQQAVLFTGMAGSITRRITIDGLDAQGRCFSLLVGRAFLHIRPDACTFQDFTIKNCTFRDTEGGAAGTANPVFFGIYFEPMNGGVVTNVLFDNILIDGTNGAAFIDDPGAITGVRLHNFRARNNNVGNGDCIISVFNSGHEIDENCYLETNAANVANPIKAGAGITIRTPRICMRVKDLPAGTDGLAAIFCPTRKTWIAKGYIVPSATILADAVDFITFRLWNTDAGSSFASFTTQATQVTLFTLNSFSANVFTVLSVIEPNTFVRFDKIDTGAGKALDDAMIILDYIPFGVT